MSSFQSKMVKPSYLSKFDDDECPWCAPKKLLRKVWWFVERWYRRLIGRKLEYIAKVFAYAKVLYNDYDWDSAYLYPLIKLKLERILKALEQGHLDQNPSDLKAIRLCIKFCARLKEDGDYYDRPMRRHDKKWGTPRYTFKKKGKYSTMNSHRKNAKTTRQKNRERKEFMAAHNASDFLRDRDRRLLFGIMAKHLPNWWD